MLRRRKLEIAALVTLFAAVIVFQVVQGVRSANPPTVTLQDGSTLQLARVSFGTEHSWNDSRWRLLTWILPRGWQEHFGIEGMSMSSREPTLGVWLLWDNQGTPGSQSYAFGCWDFRLVDQHGNEVPASSVNCPELVRGKKPVIVGRDFTAFPRRGATMKLRVYRRKTGPSERVAEFELKNPARKNHPVWSPPVAPVVVKRGDLEIRLHMLWVDGPGAGGDGRARAGFVVTERGASTDAWVPDGIEVRDATGNVARGQRLNSFTRDGYLNLDWQPYLWSDETAWDLRVEFKRKETAVFETNELVMVKALAIPAMDGVTELNLSTNRLGHEVRVLGLRSGNARLGSGDVGTSAGLLTLEVEVSPELKQKRLTVVLATDDHGREVQGRNLDDESRSSYSFGWWPKPDARSLNITLAVQEVVTAEFRVKPEAFSPTRTGKE